MPSKSNKERKLNHVLLTNGSVRKIASCDIERIAITTSSQQTPALTHLYVSTTLKLILDPQTNKDTYRNLHSNALKFIPSIIYSIDSLKE
jgi:hypothetical protein